jgi:hypothetical protein
MVSYAHNQGGADDYYYKYADSVEQHLAKYCSTVVISVIQPPKQLRALEMMGIRHTYLNGIVAQGASSRGLHLIDAYAAFVEKDDNAASIDQYGINLTTAGTTISVNAAVCVLGI